MCGIAGIAGQNVIGKANSRQLVARMSELLRHRGPDSEGIFVEEGIALAHRRLAILDLSDAGRQPMTSRDGRWTISLNGEIFNYLELREQLAGTFRTSTDTEIFLEACAAWGVETALEKCIGMFAFALWDSRERELTLARDRLGEKPLVYWHKGEALAFGSELKALAPLSDRRLDPAAVDAYLGLGYVPAPLSIFRDCRKLRAGHLLRFKDGKVDLRRWWFPDRALAAENGRSGTCPTSLINPSVGLKEMVDDAVRLRLRSDVPAALLLSGGVDSSVIAASCAGMGVRPEAFTVSFDGDETDLPYASAVAEALDLPHEVLRVGAGAIEPIFRHYDEPFADSSAVASLALARALEGRYRVVLNGDGGDEAFGGYRHYQHIRAKQALKTVVARFGLCDGRGPLQIYVQSKATFRAARRCSLLNGNWKGNALDELAPPELPPDAGAFERALWSDREMYLPNCLTYKMDIALGAAGMEGRAPFLDHRLLEWTGTLDPRELVRGSEKKILLRAAYRDQLPDQVLDRPKHGFGAPIETWLRGSLRELAEDLTPCPWFDRASQAGLTGQRLWTMLAFSSWARQWRPTW